MMSGFDLINQKNGNAIAHEISQLDIINYDTVSALVPKLLAEGKLTLDISVYKPKNSSVLEAEGVGRYLVYNHPDEENPFSIWVFAFAPRQKTTIHDHKYKGTVTVLEGPMSEKFYEPTGEGRAARLVKRVDRFKFHCNRDELDPDDKFVHQLKCRKGTGVALGVTLHIYNMSAHLISDDGHKIDRRNLSRIYCKEASGLRHEALAYEEEYPANCP